MHVKQLKRRETRYETDSDGIVAARPNRTYKCTRNYYTRIRKEAQRNFENDIIVKRIEQPKTLLQLSKGKKSCQGKDTKHKRTGQVFVKDEETCKILTNNFQPVPTEGRYFEEVNEQKNGR